MGASGHEVHFEPRATHEPLEIAVRSTFRIALACLAATTLTVGCSGSDDGSADGASSDPAGGAMQTPPPGNPPAMAPGGATNPQAELMAEYQQIQQRLSALEQQAMADSSLMQQFTALEADIQAAMATIDPEFEAKQEKLSELRQSMQAAQQSGDQAAMQAIAQEGQALEQGLQQLQASVLAQEEIAAKVTAFRDGVQSRMAEIDPEAPELIERAHDIATTVQGGDHTGHDHP